MGARGYSVRYIAILARTGYAMSARGYVSVA